VRLAIVSSVAVGLAALGSTPVVSAGQGAACAAARVHYTPYPNPAPNLSGLPWVEGSPQGVGLVGLLWYWPKSWQRRHAQPARIFTGGTAPAGYSTKVLWVFTARAAKDRGGGALVVRGRRLDGRGAFRQEFTAIGYEGQNGAPSYASIIVVPKTGCWRLELSTARLRASVVLQAVPKT
jgi:hypothetical protein